MTGVPPQAGSGHSAEPEPISVVSAETASVPNADCAECERLREEIADYMGHRTDSVAGKVWAAQLLFSAFEDDLEDLVGEFDGLGHDSYDQSLEIYGAPADLRLGEAAQRLIRGAGFGKVYVNHGARKEDGRWETHYSFPDGKALPVRGWRRRYVSDQTVSTTRVIVGPADNGYYEISYWPEGWGAAAEADLARGYYRVVPDPLDPFASAIEARSDATGTGAAEGESAVPKGDAQ